MASLGDSGVSPFGRLLASMPWVVVLVALQGCASNIAHEEAWNGAVNRAISSQSKKVKDSVSKEILSAARTLMDGTRCADLAAVTVFRYSSHSDEGGGDGDEEALRFTVEEYRGEVIQPHPSFLADLGIIVLRKPVKNLPRPVMLARSAVRRGERIIMVGYGFGITRRSEKDSGNRLAAESVVVDIVKKHDAGSRP